MTTYTDFMDITLADLRPGDKFFSLTTSESWTFTASGWKLDQKKEDTTVGTEYSMSNPIPTPPAGKTRPDILVVGDSYRSMSGSVQYWDGNRWTNERPSKDTREEITLADGTVLRINGWGKNKSGKFTSLNVQDVTPEPEVPFEPGWYMASDWIGSAPFYLTTTDALDESERGYCKTQGYGYVAWTVRLSGRPVMESWLYIRASELHAWTPAKFEKENKA